MKMGTKTVLVTVTNVEEAGTVTLSARRPESNNGFTASVTDPDGAPSPMNNGSGPKSGSRNGSYANIDQFAETATYTPVDADIGSYLRVTVTYEDPEGSGKTAAERSVFSVQAKSGAATTPPRLPMTRILLHQGTRQSASREVAENTAPGQPVGAPVDQPRTR